MFSRVTEDFMEGVFKRIRQMSVTHTILSDDTIAMTSSCNGIELTIEPRERDLC